MLSPMRSNFSIIPVENFSFFAVSYSVGGKNFLNQCRFAIKSPCKFIFHLRIRFDSAFWRWSAVDLRLWYKVTFPCKIALIFHILPSFQQCFPKVKQNQFATSIQSCISNLRQSWCATSRRHRISLWNSSYFHISNFSPLFWRWNAISFRLCKFLVHRQFATSFHRLKSPLFWCQNFAKHLNQRQTDVSGWNVILQVTLVSPSQVIFVPMSKFRKNVLIKGEKTVNRRWCDFTKQIHFSPLFCRQNSMSFQPIKSPSYHRRNRMLFRPC